jgi:hypothetical protein
MRAPIFDEGPEEKANKKEGRRKSGHPSPVSLSEEGSLVCCIGVPAGNRSTFLKENCRRKSEERSGAHIPKGLLRGAVAPNLALSYCSPASPRGFRIRRKNAIVEVQANNLSAHQMHGVKLVWGTPGKVAHVTARAFQSNYASSPKGRTIREFFEQVVFVVHGSPFPRLSEFWNDSSPV